MKVITLASRKGGTGKTTLAINLAALAALENRACVIDMDPQQSTLVWKRLREEQGLPKLPIGFCHPRSLAATLDLVRRQKTKWVFIDTPPNLAQPVIAGASCADLMVIPVRPDAQNLNAVMQTIVIARQLRKSYVVVLNEAPPVRNDVPSPLAQEARRQVFAAGMKALHAGRVWKHQITHRNALSYAFNKGHTVNERADYAEAFNELRHLWTALKRHMERQK